MPQRRQEASQTDDARADAESPQGAYGTTYQNNVEAKVSCERRKLAHAAARWAFENNKGSRVACKSGLFGDPKVVTRTFVEPLLRQLKRTGNIDDHRDHHWG